MIVSSSAMRTLTEGSLKDLEAAGLVDRRVTDDYPPATVYRLAGAGRPLARLLAQILAPTTR
jgi:DNA-binding HxlR family transcriptional regulator